MDSLKLLLGPPEIQPKLLQNPSTAKRTFNDLFTNAMVDHFNNVDVNSNDDNSLMGYTENNSATFISTGNACLDFFFHVVPDTSSESLTCRLQEAWSYHPLTTLKLICNLRGVRGTGKSDKEGFYTAALWLHKHHPKTLATNVDSMAEFGYFKDFPEILYRLLEGADVRRIAKSERTSKADRRAQKRRMKKKKKNPLITQERASEVRDLRRIEMARKAVDRFNLDPDYRLLHERISDLFAERLKSDLESLNCGEESNISLAAKWCPSLDSSFDRSTLLCETIARRIFPRDSSPEYAEIEDAHYAYRIRDRLRKEILSPLRRVLDLPEVYMSAKRWSELPYARVPSVAMKTYKEHFMKHDSERFKAYLESVKAGTAKIAAGALLPHEIIRSLNDSDDGVVAELQWNRMVSDLAEKGKMKNCIAVCDVSGSMCGEPMEVCIALGILVSDLSEEPWKGKVITFSSTPELHLIEGDDLQSRASFVGSMDWGMNTDFQKVFDRILKVATKANLKADEMIKRVFVFSDMEFDEASTNTWETDYMVIEEKYRENGYPVPEIVFWNLRDSRATPVMENQKGVALVSGFSKNVLKLFLEDEKLLTPLNVMADAISGEAYQKLVVLD